MTSPSDCPPPPRRALAPFDVALALLVLAFAFLSASYPVRDSGLWMHLAVGRLLGVGEYQFGVDPLSYTTSGVYWANHAWLFDLILYLVYQHLGGAAVVVFKAAAVALLAGVWLSCRRGWTGVAGPAAAAVLGVLALAPWLQLQPLLCSAVLLALTVAILALHVDPCRPKGCRVWVLVPLFALWVNVDGWFFLGPLTLALFWVGERLGGPARERRLSLGLVGAGLVACLLSPHHVFAFALPPEVSPAVLGSGLRDDARFAPFFQRGYVGLFERPDWYARLPGAAALALFVGGALSFVRCGRACADGRLFVWLAVAALGAWNSRLIPLFVAVAVPILVLNLQDARTRNPAAVIPARPRWQRVAVRLLAGGAGLGLIAFAWLGGPLGVRPDKRRVAWEVQPDPGLKRSAELRASWRQRGRLSESDRVFHLHPDSANYAAWFAPGERCFLDQRFQLFVHVIPQYRDICRDLTPLSGAVTPPSSFGITCVVAHDPDIDRLKPTLNGLWRPGSGHVLLDLRGREAMFGIRKVVRDGESFDRWRLDLDKLVYLPAGGDDRAPPSPPPTGPELGGMSSPWEHLWRPPPPPRPAEGDTAALLLQYVEDQVAVLAPEIARSQAAAAVASLVATGAGEFSPLALGFRLDQTALLLPPMDSAPPSGSLLAIRAARGAIAAAPDDPVAQLRLGQAYLALTYTTREAVWADRSRLLAQLRHVQATCALERAVALAPDLEAAHALLVRIYAQRGMHDAALHHLREQVRILSHRRAEGTAAPRLRQLREELDAYETVVQDRRGQLALRSQGLGNAPLARANIALRLGLSRTALDDVLLPSTVVLFGVEGARLEMELLVMLGRTGRARQELDDDEFRLNQERLGVTELPGNGFPNHPPVYRLPAYAWNRFLLAAADGDYRQAGESLEAIAARLKEERAARDRNAHLFLVRALAADVGLGAQPELWRLYKLVAGDPSQVLRIVDQLNRTSTQVEADLRCLAGLLALERGLPEEAAEHFRAARALAGSQSAPDAGFPSEPLCRAYLGRLQDGARR